MRLGKSGNGAWAVCGLGIPAALFDRAALKPLRLKNSFRRVGDTPNAIAECIHKSGIEWSDRWLKW
jgi:hypothetical protein